MAKKFAMLGASATPRLSSTLEAQRLLDTLLQGENPEFTESGRRILSVAAVEDLDKRF